MNGNHLLNANEMTQLIYYDFTINEDIDKHVVKTGFDKVGKNYNTVAIIGAQSTGKSTLLNKLFDTNFEVMTTTIGRGQTTKGVWAACHTATRVFILDCEGTDSKERGEDRHKFEHSSSLFCLAMADVLIINMWTNDVGRYTASNYGVLKIVFEMNLKLFQQECSKKILVVLRDFDPKRNIKSKIQELILQDIKNIWNDIKKPEKYQNSEPSNFFEFEFITLPHKKYCEEQFETEVKDLRHRLNEASSDYIFKHVSKEKNVPADGIKQYINQLWTDIVNEKELNIPSQKEMLSNYRCNEIRDQVLTENEHLIKEVSYLSSKENLDNFKERCLKIFDTVISQYDKVASNYVDKIYLSVRKQIESTLSQQFYMCFANQAKRMIPISQKYMRQELQKEIKNKGDNFFQITENLKSKYLKNLMKILIDKKVFDYWNVSQEEYSDVFDEIIESQRKVCLEEKKNQIIKSLKKQLEESFVSKIENFTPNFWIDFNQDYFNLFGVKMFSMKHYLRDFYRMPDENILHFGKQIETEVYSNIKKDFSRKTKEISNIAIDLFKKKFWYEKDNTQRLWNRYEEEEIDNLFKKCRAEFSDLFEIFKIFKICSPFKYLDYENTEPENFENVLKNASENLPNIIEKQSDSFEVLMRQNEISSMKRKFEEGISQILEDAKRRKSGFFSNSLPWWGWALLAFFGFDDLLRWIKSLWIIPILLLIGTYYLLNHLNLTHVPKNLYYDFEDKVNKVWKKIFK